MRKIMVFMKNKLVIALFAGIVILFSACKNDGVDCKYHAETLDLTILQKDWQFDEDIEVFYYRMEVPEVTNYVYNYGTWTINREYNKGTRDAFQVALPMTEFKPDTLTDGSVVYYTRHIDYVVSVGFVEIQLVNSDHLYAPGNPETMYFRMQLVY